jgi:uncharacterized protein YoxC
MLLTISVAVIAASIAVAVCFLIPLLLQIRRTARELEKTVETVRTEIPPVSRDLTVISQEIKGIVESIRWQVDRVEEGVTSFRDTALHLRNFEEGILHRVEEPLFKLAALASAARTGVETFIGFFRR